MDSTPSQLASAIGPMTCELLRGYGFCRQPMGAYLCCKACDAVASASCDDVVEFNRGDGTCGVRGDRGVNVAVSSFDDAQCNSSAPTRLAAAAGVCTAASNGGTSIAEYTNGSIALYYWSNSSGCLGPATSSMAHLTCNSRCTLVPFPVVMRSGGRQRLATADSGSADRGGSNLC